ncbi:Hypothetical_protein [Hexamita inflata]|uniref:Hypothetical_protein n=1 Tax=Hexamita inflata TaxID=28002 RepID=A0AA86R8A4_9EUKA|nr:Hypothetical protein HINF_LOCUS33643 [Hexamita inflata]CAI9968087.1 Hypothetical protein HINF_LOCUS55732 [Hexamita inflata]
MKSGYDTSSVAITMQIKNTKIQQQSDYIETTKKITSPYKLTQILKPKSSPSAPSHASNNQLTMKLLQDGVNKNTLECIAEVILDVKDISFKKSNQYNQFAYKSIIPALKQIKFQDLIFESAHQQDHIKAQLETILFIQFALKNEYIEYYMNLLTFEEAITEILQQSANLDQFNFRYNIVSKLRDLTLMILPGEEKEALKNYQDSLIQSQVLQKEHLQHLLTQTVSKPDLEEKLQKLILKNEQYRQEIKSLNNIKALKGRSEFLNELIEKEINTIEFRLGTQ